MKKDWRKRRQDNLSELTLSAHILAYLIAVIILIAGTSIEQYTFFSATTLFIVIVFPAALFILLDLYILQQKFGRRVEFAWNLTKQALLFIVITVVLIIFNGEQLWLFSSIYLIPVLLSCITLGKWWGMIFAGAGAGSLFWLSRGMDFAGNQAIGPFEAVLVLGTTFFLLAWLLGGIIDVEKRTTEQIRQEHDLIARMMETSPSGIMVLNHQREIIYANARVEQIFNFNCNEKCEVSLFKKEGDVSSCVNKVLHKVFAIGEPVHNCMGFLCNDDEKISYVSISGAPIFNSSGNIEQVVLTIDDITNQKIMNDELLKADKLESLSLLAGGIAHDFNNFLTVMLGNISLIKMKYKYLKLKNLEHMENAVIQARELTRKLSVFAKGDAPVKKTIQLQNLLSDTAGFTLTGSEAIYEIVVEDNLMPVEADETQIGQAISNILINAIQAMPTGGKIIIDASNMTIDSAKDELPLPEGKYVCIKISDEGIGIPDDLLSKIFDPFFSTKAEGKGLGLASSYKIIEAHGGLIRAESQLGAGSTFYICLPASQELYPTYTKVDKDLSFGEGHLLILDDNELILKTCGNMLEYLGYNVSYAQDGAEVLRLYQEATEAGSAYDLVILDLTIPGGMGGRKTIEWLKQYDPNVKAIVSSGYYDAPILLHYKDYGFSGFISKPYQIRELSKTIKKVLEN